MANTDTKRRVRVWLAENSKTQNWLAHRLKISNSLLSMILDGYRPPSDSVAGRIQRITGVDVRPESTVESVAIEARS